MCLSWTMGVLHLGWSMVVYAGSNQDAKSTKRAWLQEKPILVKAVLARSRKRKLTTTAIKNAKPSMINMPTGSRSDGFPFSLYIAIQAYNLLYMAQSCKRDL